MKYANITACSHTHTKTDRDREVQNLQQPINLRELANLLKNISKKQTQSKGIPNKEKKIVRHRLHKNTRDPIISYQHHITM